MGKELPVTSSISESICKRETDILENRMKKTFEYRVEKMVSMMNSELLRTCTAEG